jgi:hypothetical protein
VGQAGSLRPIGNRPSGIASSAWGKLRLFAACRYAG